MSKPLPAAYAWLLEEPAPKMLLEALKLYGVEEKAGPKNNPQIIKWAGECFITGYNMDSIPWCGLAMAVFAKRAGKTLPASPLWARDWAKWGDACEPELGCVMVFVREGGFGHVALYVGEDNDNYHVIGGNQSDSVSIVRISKSRLLASRASYKVKPSNVRKVFMSADGPVSRNEV